MKMTKLFFYLTIALFGIISCKNAQPLFEETSGEWLQIGDAEWQFDADQVIGTGPGPADQDGFIATKKRYGDFILEMDFNPDSTINSGVFLRCEKDEPSATDCYEINIWDSNPNQDYRTGGIVTKFSPTAKVETINKWNTYKIKCENNHIQVWIDGISVMDVTDEDLKQGYICLQARGKGTIKFRDIKIREL